MGRGRSKAKQTKIARELKYAAPDTDLTRLRAELSAAPPGTDEPELGAAEEPEDAEDEG